MNAATINKPNQYISTWRAEIGKADGSTVSTAFGTRAEAAAFIQGQGAELLTNKKFNDEMYLRSYIARQQREFLAEGVA